MVDNPIYESADRYQNRQTMLQPNTLNAAEESSIYSVVADERRVAREEECQRNVIDSASNASVCEENKYVTVLGQDSTDDGCTDSNKC